MPFNNFPFLNLNNFNLDWIITKIKDIATDSETARTAATEAAQSAAVASKIAGTLKPYSRSIKILFIGNSYTRDSIRWLWKVLSEAGFVDVVIGHPFIGSLTLSEQYTNLLEGTADYAYYKYTAINPVITNAMTLGDCIADENWDIVVFQQQSDRSGEYDSYVSPEFDITNLIQDVTSRITPTPKTAIFSAWSHPKAYDGNIFVNKFNRDPNQHLWSIQDVTPRVANYCGNIDFIINAGEAMRVARLNPILATLPNELIRPDNNHLLYGIPEFMISYLIAATLCGVTKNMITWYPTSIDNPNISVSNAALADLAKDCADHAVSFVNRPDIWEEGSDDYWRWKLYSNGTAEYDGRITATDTTWTELASGQHISNQIVVPTPRGLTDQVLSVMAARSCVAVTPSGSSTAKNITFYLIAPAPLLPTQDVRVHIRLSGKWKYVEG